MSNKILSALICIVFIFSMVTSAFAAMPNEAEKQYTYVSNITASLSINSGTAKAGGLISASKMKTALTVHLQKKEGTTWTTVATWSGTNASGTTSVSDSKSVQQGYSYRVAVTGKVYDSNGKVVETVSKYSATKSY